MTTGATLNRLPVARAPIDGTTGRILPGQSVMASFCAFTSSAVAARTANAGVSAASELSAIASAILGGQASLAATLSISSSGAVSRNGSAALSGVAFLNPAASIKSASASIAAESSMLVSGGIIRHGTSVFESLASLSADPLRLRMASAEMNDGQSALSALARRIALSSAVMPGSLTLVAPGSAIRSGTATLSSQSEFLSEAIRLRLSTAIIEAIAALSAQPSASRLSSSALDIHGDLSAFASRVASGSTIMLSVGLLTGMPFFPPISTITPVYGYDWDGVLGMAVPESILLQVLRADIVSLDAPESIVFGTDDESIVYGQTD